MGTKIDVASLGKEGYVIRTVGDNLVIVGGEPARQSVRRVWTVGRSLGVPLVRAPT